MKHVSIFIILLLFVPFATHADSHPTIGTIQASGATADDEFVVLENTTAQNIDIGSWSIQYKSAKGTSFYKKNFAKGASIAANGSYVACGKDFIGACDMRHSSFSLSSSGGTVFLVLDQALLTSSESTSIIDSKTYADDDVTQPPQENPVLTNIPPASKPPEIFPIIINEIMSAPIDGDEWIELYDGNNYAIDLAGWTLSDGTGNTFLTLDGLIMPTQFKLIKLASSRLNDSGDLIILRDAAKSEIDRVAYGDWDDNAGNAPIGTDGTAIARIGDGVDSNRDNYDFALTTTPTPGATNLITKPKDGNKIITSKSQTNYKPQQPNYKTDLQWLADLLEKKNSELADLLKADNVIIVNNLYVGTDVNSKNQEPTPKTATISKTTAATVKTTTTKPAGGLAKTTPTASGQVIVPAGIVGADICVVREKNRSIEVRLPKDLVEKPSVGDAITANGSWSTAKTLTMPRLLVKTATAFKVIGHDTPPIPTEIPISRADEHVGEIISTQGTVVEKQPLRLRISDGEASLVIKSKSSAAKGDRLAATGLLTSDATDKYLTLLNPDGLSIIKPPAEKEKGIARKALPYGLAAVPAVILSTAAYFGKKIKKKNVNKD